MPRAPKPCPPDFAQRANAASSKALREYYNASGEMIAAWRRETNTPPPSSSSRRSVGFKQRPLPEDFAERAPGMTMNEARHCWRTDTNVLMRWAFQAGIRFRPTRKVINRANLDPVDRDSARDMSRAGQAAHYLRKFSRVFRCDSVGNPLPDGAYWMRGRAVLTDDELIERAIYKGWDENAWKRCAA